MDQKKLNRINFITNDLHDSVASINEELVDGDYKKVSSIITKLISDLRSLRTNVVENNEI